MIKTLPIIDNMSVIVRRSEDCIEFVPMFSNSFSLPKYILPENASCEDYDATADKIRFYRQQRNLTQLQMAAVLQIDRITYISWEQSDHRLYKPAAIDKIAEVFNVSPEVLLDDYNRFIYHGQGTRLRELRGEKTQAKFASEIGVKLATYKEWEQERITMSFKTWDKLRYVHS